MIEGIALDLEGTVVNVEPAHHGSWIRAAAEIGVVLSSPQEAIQKCPHFSGGPNRSIIEEIYALLPGEPLPSEQQITRFLIRKWSHYDNLVNELDLSPRPGFLDIHEKLRLAGLPVTIGTAVELDRGLLLMRRSGLDKLFLLFEIVFVTDVEHSKPEPDFFLATAHRMQVRPARQLVFEDSPRGVQSGVAAGSRVIGMPVYDDDLTKRRLMEAGAYRVVTDWRDINVEEILRL